MRKVCFATGTRAEYGLLHDLMRAVAGDPGLALQLVVSGMHLEARFGHTVDEIERDGFAIDARVDMELDEDSPAGIARSMGLATAGFGQAFARLKPDVLVLLGDRYEALAAAQAALVARIPIAHIHGGEATWGAVDDAIRHAITKMAHLHLVAAEPFRRRVVQLGEDPGRVHAVGAPGLDRARTMDLLSRSELEESLGFRFGTPFFLVTYHPATLMASDPALAAAGLLEALLSLEGATLLVTLPNADVGALGVIHAIEAVAAAAAERILVAASLGQQRYLSAITCCDAVVGNSSSGLIEVPFFRKPTVNVGARQDGRLKAPSVIDCDETPAAIRAAVERALSAEFQAGLAGVESPYGDGHAVPRMLRLLRELPLGEGLSYKRFHDYAVPA